MSPIHPNVAALHLMAQSLEHLRERVVFVGGATVNLLITDPGAPMVRVTDDVDCIVEVATAADYRRIEEELRALGFVPDPDGPVCRYLIAGAKLDVMPTDPAILGFANRWAAEAISRSDVTRLDDLSIRVVTAPYFVGTKVDAFRNRGDRDLRGSRDIEDLIAVADGRESLPAEVRSGASDDLKHYLRVELGALLHEEAFLEAVSAHMPSDAASQGRVPTVLARLRAVAADD